MTDASSATQRLTSALEDAVAAGVTPGAICEVTRAGSATITASAGSVAAFDGAGARLADDAREGVTDATIYDLASVSKIFTSITLLSLADRGMLDLDASIAQWLPAYRTPEKSAVTIAHLLSHTSGLPSTCPQSWRDSVRDAGTRSPQWISPDRSTVLDRILTAPLAHPTGTDKVYSCLGYVTAMAIAEAVTDLPWTHVVRSHVLEPLHLNRTTFAPDASCTAPTEHQPHLGRGMVHGVVHDETACALGGAGGNAGLFAPVRELTTLGSALLAGLPGVLSAASFGRLWDDQLPALLGEPAGRVEQEIGYGQSLGLRIGQTSWMSAAGVDARGHTGFTGTSILVDRDEELVVALLTNRVHPGRDRSDATELRRTINAIAYES